VFDVKDLRCFVAVYERRGFARAATQLHTVQSAVSTRIRKLESMVGAPLFERMHRGIAATNKGHVLYRHAKRVLDQFDELEKTVRGERAA
jgi:LysR family nitrogen assimilation transcriptional regulator